MGWEWDVGIGITTNTIEGSFGTQVVVGTRSDGWGLADTTDTKTTTSLDTLAVGLIVFGRARQEDQILDGLGKLISIKASNLENVVGFSTSKSSQVGHGKTLIVIVTGGPNTHSNQGK